MSRTVLHNILFVGVPVLAQVMILLLGLFSASAHSQTYDALVAMVANPDSSVRMKGEERIARIIKETILSGELDPDRGTENTFCFGHFVSATTFDLAVGISTVPYGGNLIVLSQRNGHYMPVRPVTGIGHIESIELVRLFSGQLDQLALNLYTGGTGLRHWAKDIYCWDGKDIRMIWAWVRKEVYSEWQPSKPREYRGHIIRSDITMGNMRRDGAREIMTSTVVEEGIFGPKGLGLATVTSKNEKNLIHRWDQSLFFYVAEYGEISASHITVPCQEGIPPKKGPGTLGQGVTIGIMVMPGFFQPDSEHYAAVVGKERFCEVPKSAVKLRN